MRQRLTSEAVIKSHRLIHGYVQLIEFCRLAADLTMLLYNDNFTGLLSVSRNPGLAASAQCTGLL